MDKIKSYLEDGIQEDLVIEVLKITAQKAPGNPCKYIESILNSLLHEGVYTVEEFKKREGDNEDEQIQKNDRKKEKGTQKENLEEYYRKGYR